MAWNCSDPLWHSKETPSGGKAARHKGNDSKGVKQ